MTHYAPLISALVTLLLTAILVFSKAGKAVQDIPNERSLHGTPVPRIGGVGLVAGILSGWAIVAQSMAWWVVLPVVLLFVVSLLDDMQGLPVRKRLVAHVLATALLVTGSDLLMQNPVLALLVLLFVVWMTNLYNFMDGSDGLAGGMALFGFGAYAVAAWLAGDARLALASASVSSSALAFLAYNFHPARIFMGDSGSISLGFLAGAIGLIGWQHGIWPLWFPVAVFSPFIVDATVTLFKRLLRGEKIWQAHCSHYYQQLVQSGWGHRKTAVTEYALMLAVGSSAVFLLTQPRPVVFSVLILWVLVYAAIMRKLDRLWATHVRN